jgi:hypothetical protein
MWLVLLSAWATAQDDGLSVLHFRGKLLNDQGEPLSGAQVQFWQTDENGNYNHPQFSTGGVPLEDDFQYFGTSSTEDDGSFDFRTYRPGIYSERPVTHIHYKVWWQGNDILTSQFYFADEGLTQFSDLLQLELSSKDDGSQLTDKTIVVDLGLGGTLPITPTPAEGPYYPVIDFFGFDSDMTNVSAIEQKPTSEGTQASTAPSPAPNTTPVPPPPTTPTTTNDVVASETSPPTFAPTTASPTESSSTTSISSHATSLMKVFSSLLVWRFLSI